jgi:hypothetical protein
MPLGYLAAQWRSSDIGSLAIDSVTWNYSTAGAIGHSCRVQHVQLLVIDIPHDKTRLASPVRHETDDKDSQLHSVASSLWGLLGVCLNHTAMSLLSDDR